MYDIDWTSVTSLIPLGQLVVFWWEKYI